MLHTNTNRNTQTLNRSKTGTKGDGHQ